MSSDITNRGIAPDAWYSLRAYTAARIALGKTGVAIPLHETLQFRLAHAYARDAVYSVLKKDELLSSLSAFHLPVFLIHSMANNRNEYLQRPDLGRRLNDDSVKKLGNFHSNGFDVCIVVADGLSATAINEHAIPVLQQLIPLLQKAKFNVAPLCLAEEGRVAIADEIGFLLSAKISVILIGERPGLSSPDSMGAYLTYHPLVGLTDEKRNCISNIRPEGLIFSLAAEKIFHLLKESLRLKISGVALKDYTAVRLK